MRLSKNLPAAQKNAGYVYSGGQILARQAFGNVVWTHTTPAGTTKFNGATRTEFDPLGADVGVNAPQTPDTGGGQGDLGGMHTGGLMDSRYSDMFNVSAGCTIDGMAGSCSQAVDLLNRDVAYEEGDTHCAGVGCIFSSSTSRSGAYGPSHSGAPGHAGGADNSGAPEHTMFSMFGGGYLMDSYPDMTFIVNVPISFHGEIVVGGYMTINGSFIPQNTGLTPFTGKNLRKYDKQRAIVRDSLENSDSCRQFLAAHGIDPDAALDAVNQQLAYNGPKSTVSRGQAGTWDLSGDDYKQMLATDPFRASALLNGPVSGDFRLHPEKRAEIAFYPGGVYGATVAARSTVFFRGSGLRAGTILHEALHALTGLGDEGLASQLGVTLPDDGSTDIITRTLVENGCGVRKRRK